MKHINIIIFLMLPFVVFSQTVRRTDTRYIEDEWRYYPEKKFNSWALTAGFGAFWMYADVTDFKFIPNNIKGTPSVILSKHLVPAIALDFQYLYGNMYGESKNPIYYQRDPSDPLYPAGRKENTDIYFKGDFHQFTLSGVFFINQMLVNAGPIKDKWDIYLKVGAGASFFRSKLYLSNNEVVSTGMLVPNPYDGGEFFVNGYNIRNHEKKTSRSINVVFTPATYAGVMYRINNSFDLALELGMYISLSDHYDNILTGTTNDNAFYSGLFLSYKFGKKDKRHLRWTYRGLDMNLFGRPKKNPMLTEIALLEDDILKFQEGREIKTNTVIITESDTLIYQPAFVRTIFFPKNEDKKFIDTNIIKDKDEELVFMGEVIIQMKYNPNAILEVYSHVEENSSGNHDEISRKQGEQIIDFLVNSLGGNRDRMKLHAMGSSEPLSTTEEDNQKGFKEKSNRRVELVLMLH